MKDKNNREVIVETLTTCIKHMPHKVNLYSYLIAVLSLEDFDFATLITKSVVQLLNEALVQLGDCFMSKNASRVLGNLAQYGLISSEAFCQLLLQLIEDYQKLPGADSLTGSKTHSADLLLETVLAALPQTKQKMQKEQSIDFGTIVEYLKQIFKLRERARQI